MCHASLCAFGPNEACYLVKLRLLMHDRAYRESRGTSTDELVRMIAGYGNREMREALALLSDRT